MEINNIIQIVIILTSGIILYMRFVKKDNLNGFKNWYGAIFQMILIFLYIRELSVNDLSFKKWYWFAVDFLLIIYFYLRITEKK